MLITGLVTAGDIVASSLLDLKSDVYSCLSLFSV